MTPQERDLILGLFQRLTPPPEGDIDGEARALIDGLVRQQPLAPYLLVQTALVQESPSRARRRRSPIWRPSSPRPRLRPPRRRRGGASSRACWAAKRRAVRLTPRPPHLNRLRLPRPRRDPGAPVEAPASCSRRCRRPRAWPGARCCSRASSICWVMAAAPSPMWPEPASPSRQKTSPSIISRRHPRMSRPATTIPGRTRPIPATTAPRSMIPASTRATTASATTADSRTSEERTGGSARGRVAAQPRPTKGILVAMTVRNRALASAGRSAMNSTAFATFETSITGSIASVPLA